MLVQFLQLSHVEILVDQHDDVQNVLEKQTIFMVVINIRVVVNFSE